MAAEEIKALEEQGVVQITDPPGEPKKIDWDQERMIGPLSSRV
jgi:hypothetical protein